MIDDTLVFAGIMPHAPILARGVGQAQHHMQAGSTIRAMTDIAHHVVASLPDTVVLISPHSPRHPGAFGIWHTALLCGSLEQFGASETRVALPLDREFADRLEAEVNQGGHKTWRITNAALDHGATVPLSFLVAAGWESPTVVIGLNSPGEGGLEDLGRAITASATALGRRIAVIASGDMSHRLAPAAPGGYDAEGVRFDHTFIDLLRAGATTQIDHLDTNLLAHAAEDVVDSTRVALAATHGDAGPASVLSYEGPFGVGYGVAILTEHPVPNVASAVEHASDVIVAHGADLPGVARRAVIAQLEDGPSEPPFKIGEGLRHPSGVFVTIRGPQDALRGCCGSIIPSHADLVHETWQCARTAAFHDSRFSPLRPEELEHVRFTVSILSELERVSSPAELDPAIYGIVIRSPRNRTSVLLPGIKGIESPLTQIRAAKRKAGMKDDERIEIQRFTTRVFHEPPPEET